MRKFFLTTLCCAVMVSMAGCIINLGDTSSEPTSSNTTSSEQTSSEQTSSEVASSEIISSENSSSESPASSKQAASSSNSASSVASKTPPKTSSNQAVTKPKITFGNAQIPFSKAEYITYTITTGSEDISDLQIKKIYKAHYEGNNDGTAKESWELIYNPVPQTVAVIYPANGKYEQKCNIKNVVKEPGVYKIVVEVSEELKGQHFFEVYDDAGSAAASTNWEAWLNTKTYPVGTDKLVFNYKSGNGNLDTGNSFSLYRLNDDGKWEDLIINVPNTATSIAKPNTQGSETFDVGNKLDKAGKYKVTRYIGGKNLELEFTVY